MKVLVVHSWLRGNLGDVLQGSVLLRALRGFGPESLDLAGFPAHPGEGARELVELADRLLPEPFLWYWRFTPAAARARWLEPRWRRERAALFSRYDAVVSMPGPFLAQYDARAPAALLDLEIAAEAGVPCLLASHSVGPLPAGDLRRVAQTKLCVAREERTHAYLAEHGVPAVRSADLAFLYPYADALARAPAGPVVGGRYRLLFLRSRHLPMRAVRWNDGGLRCGPLPVPLESDEQVVLATSDAARDARFVTALAERLGVRSVVCRSVPELVALIAGSSGVVSDRYHPAICAAVLGRPAEVIPNHEPHKMLGLQGLLRDRPLEELRNLARNGLEAIRAALSGGAAVEPDRSPPPPSRSPSS
jgi:polysaccharide pyruvyl transferase WcaK-like protein